MARAKAKRYRRPAPQIPTQRKTGAGHTGGRGLTAPRERFHPHRTAGRGSTPIKARSGRAARDDSKKKLVCNTLRSRLIFKPENRNARPGGPQRRRTPRRDVERGPPKAARQDGRNGNRRGVEPGRMERECPRLENMPMNRREAAKNNKIT